MRSTRDLRDALPNRGLSISELDLRLVHRKEEERSAADTLKRNFSFGRFSDNVKDIFGKNNPTESALSENIQTSMKVPSSAMPKLRACSKSVDHSSSNALKLNPNISGRKLRVSLPSICVTPPVSEAEGTPCFPRKLGSTPENDEALGGSACATININQLKKILQAKEAKKENENKQLLEQEEKENACGETNGVNKQQGGSKEFSCKGNSAHEEQTGQERDIKTESHGMYKAETEKDLNENRFAEKEQENPVSSETDICFAVSSFIASGDGEMTVFEGDEVKVISKAPCGWWMVHVDGVMGWVPSNFLVAGDGQEEEDSQESLESDGDQENEGLFLVEDDGDEDEHEHEEDDEEDDDGGFNILSGGHDTKDDGKFSAKQLRLLSLGCFKTGNALTKAT